MIIAAISLSLVAGLVYLVRRRRQPPVHKGMGPRLELVPVHRVVRIPLDGVPMRVRDGSRGPHRLPAGGGR